MPAFAVLGSHWDELHSVCQRVGHAAQLSAPPAEPTLMQVQWTQLARCPQGRAAELVCQAAPEPLCARQ
jgi:hypothetical protein